MSIEAIIKQQIKTCELAIGDGRRVLEGYKKQTALVTEIISSKTRELVELKRDLERFAPEDKA